MILPRKFLSEDEKMLFYIIAILCPAVISVAILHIRIRELKLFHIRTLVEYVVFLLVNVFFSTLLVCILLGSDVRIDAFMSFTFFIKYVAIATILAVLIPYVYLIARTYIKIQLVIEDYEEDYEEDNE